MRKLALAATLSVVFTAASYGTELQGVLADWNCTQAMVRHGRAKVLKQRLSCSLMKNVRRAAYGLITQDKKYYRIDPQSNDRVLQILANTPDKDNTKVVISGDLQGDTLKINTISLL
jgi:hypothetical protein